MINYAQINLGDAAIGGVGPLPLALRGLADESLSDLGAALNPCPPEWQGLGYWPVVAEPMPPLTGREVAEPADDTALVVDAAAQVVRRPWVVTEPPPAYQMLTANQLIDLIVGAAGEAAFVAAWADPSLELWRVKVSVARDIGRVAASTAAGLDALVAAGHLTTAQRQQVLDTWPQS